MYFSVYLQVILTGATSTELLICNADIEIKQKTDPNCTTLMPLHSSTPQVYWFGHLIKLSVLISNGKTSS